MTDHSTTDIVCALGRFGENLKDLREHLDEPRADLLWRLDRLQTTTLPLISQRAIDTR
jgi:hypothetical protein